jgi:mono/diheme cytochrome c family protein
MQPITSFRRKYLVGLGSFVGLIFLALASGQAYGQTVGAPANGLPPGDGMSLVAVACTQCHGLRTIMTLRDGPTGWKIFVDNMILRGAQLRPQEADTVIQYLSQHFGPGAGPMQVGKAESQPLPNGPGQNLVQSHCTLCHDLSRVTGSKRSKTEWDSTVQGMMGKVNGMATPQDMETMASYLATQFGKSTE